MSKGEGPMYQWPQPDLEPVSQIRRVIGMGCRVLAVVMPVVLSMIVGALVMCLVGTYYLQTYHEESCQALQGVEVDAFMEEHGVPHTATVQQFTMTRDFDIRRGHVPHDTPPYVRGWYACGTSAVPPTE